MFDDFGVFHTKVYTCNFCELLSRPPQRYNAIFECTILTRGNFIATEISRRHQHINVRCFEQCATYKDLQHFATHSAIATVGYRCRVADRSSAAGFLIEPMW